MDLRKDRMNSGHSPFTIEHLPSDRSAAWEQNLRDLTARAGHAAELGRWDQVEECYRLRGEQLQNHLIPPALATELTQFDRAVEARIVNARTALQSQLIETVRIRQNLQGLRSWQRSSSAESTFMDRQA
jgi:hypothetical protein